MTVIQGHIKREGLSFMYMSLSLGRYGKREAFLIRTKDEAKEAEGPKRWIVVRREFRFGQDQCRLCLRQVSCIHRTSFLRLFARSILWSFTTQFKSSLSSVGTPITTHLHTLDIPLLLHLSYVTLSVLGRRAKTV